MAADTSTIDPSLASGEGIQIEQRSEDEVTQFRGTAAAPPGIAALNPSFDVTPNRLVAAIVTEMGIARAPYTESLNSAVEAAGGQ